MASAGGCGGPPWAAWRRVRGPARLLGGWGCSLAGLGGRCGFLRAARRRAWGLAHLWGGRAVVSAGAGSGAGSLELLGAAWGCPAGDSTRTAASARRRSSRSAGVSPAQPSKTGERERDRRSRQLSRLGEHSESDILAALSDRYMVCAAPSCVPRRLSPSMVRQWCAVRGAMSCQGSASGTETIYRRWGSRRARGSAHSVRHSPGSGAGLRALGPQGLSGVTRGSRTRYTPQMEVISRTRRKVCTSSQASTTGWEGRSTAAATCGGPLKWAGVAPKTCFGSSRVGATRRSWGGARALLPEGLPPVVGAPGPGKRRAQEQVGPAALYVGGRRKVGAPGGLPGESVAHNDVREGGLVLSYSGLVGGGGGKYRLHPPVICRNFPHLQVPVQQV